MNAVYDHVTIIFKYTQLRLWGHRVLDAKYYFGDENNTNWKKMQWGLNHDMLNKALVTENDDFFVTSEVVCL